MGGRRKLRKLRRRLFGASRRERAEAQAAAAASPFNWDNCDPDTNGEFFLIERMAQDWSLCLDIGANTGEFAHKILDVNPACRVICFEPNSDLHEQIAARGIDEIHGQAVSAGPGHVDININTTDPSQTSMFRDNDNCVPRSVESISIDDFLQSSGIDRVSFVKIDTEGNEYNVIAGAKETLDRGRIDMLQFEYGGTFIDSSRRLEDIFTLLNPNYLIFHVYERGLLPLHYSEWLETFRYSNWVAVSRAIDLVGP